MSNSEPWRNIQSLMHLSEYLGDDCWEFGIRTEATSQYEVTPVAVLTLQLGTAMHMIEMKALFYRRRNG